MALDEILVPLDGSELSARVLPIVAALAPATGAKVVLLRVVEEDKGQKDRPRFLDACYADLEQRLRVLEAIGLKAQGEVLSGDPADRIVVFAREHHSSLIAMASHGRSGFSRWIRGSIAERVLRTSPVPLLMVTPFSLKEGAAPSFAKILVPLDGSALSRGILPLIKEIARAFGSEVILHQCVQVPVVEYPVGGLIMSDDEAKAMLRDQARELEGVNVSIHADIGIPAWSIVETADREKVDLVAMSTHGRSGVARWVFGSTAEHVFRHCPTPLLVNPVVPRGN
jgi:nucleotide-binding universal stress UspA family protein